MPTIFQAVQGFAGASGVGMLCLTGLFLIVSVFATNLPLVTTWLVADSNWSAVVSLPVLVIAYVVGLLAISSVDAWTHAGESNFTLLREPAVASRHSQLEQEAEILSGSVVAFGLLGIAALANTHSFPGWTRTLLFSAMLCFMLSFLAWKVSAAKRQRASRLLRQVSSLDSVTSRSNG